MSSKSRPKIIGHVWRRTGLLVAVAFFGYRYAMRLIGTLAVLLPLAASAVLCAEDFNRTLQTSVTPHLSLNSGAGYIHLVVGSANGVRITGHVRKDSSWHFGNSEGDHLKLIVNNPPIEKTAEGVTIGRSNDRDLYQHITIDYDVTLPSGSSIEARSGSGDIRGHSFTGPLAAHTGSGDIEVGEIGNGARLDTGSGSIRANNICDSVTARSRSGSGDIEVHQTVAGDLNAGTGSGSIRIQGADGSLRASTGSGDIEIQGKIVSDWKVDTGSGSIRLNLGSDAHFGVAASTGSGNIRTEQQIVKRGLLNPHRFIGSVNGGGPIAHLQTGSGDIQIR